MTDRTMEETGVQDRPVDQSKLSTADLARAANLPAVVPDKPEQAAHGDMDQRDGQPEPLLLKGQAEQFRTRWSSIQIGFVDEPKKSVEEADMLVAEVMKQLAVIFARERGNLEKQWSQGNDVSTEDLRVALRRYRSFFDRLLSV